jgi:hypothetical protein
MKQIFLLITMLLISINLYSAPPDSCLKYYYHPDTTFFNPDSVMVDSCEGSPTYGEYYGKKYFTLKFNYNIIPRTYLAPADSIIEYTIDSIGIQYTSAKNEFSQLLTTYGNFSFREKVPNMPDTTIVLGRTLYLIFDNNVPINEVENQLTNFSSIKTAYFSSWFGVESDVSVSKSNTDEIFLFPNPVSEFLMIHGLEESHVQSISIFNTFGQKLYEGDLKEQIDVSSLTPGVYFLHMGNMNYKFVKL